MVILLKIFTISLALFFIVVSGWDRTYSIGSIALIFPFIALLLISSSFIELKMRERICFKECYFKDSSLFAKLLLSKIFVTIFYIFVSIAMSISTMFSVIFYPIELWFYLILHVGVVTVIYLYLHLLLKNSINSRYISLLAREWSINISSLILISIFIYITLQGYEPKYLTDSLEESIIKASSSISSNSHIINFIIKLKIEIDSLFWWIVVDQTQTTQNSYLKFAIWSIFLLINALALLGINRVIGQIIYIVSLFFRKEKP